MPTGYDRTAVPNSALNDIKSGIAPLSKAPVKNITQDDLDIRNAFDRQTAASKAIANILEVIRQTTANRAVADQQVKDYTDAYNKAL